MAGFLDFLQTPDAQLGIGLLAAGGYSPTPMTAGQRIAGAVGSFQAQQAALQDAKLKRQLVQSQIDENTVQSAARLAALQQQQRRDAMFLGGSSGLLNSAPATTGAPVAGAPAGAASGAAVPATPGGEVLKQVTGAPPNAPPPDDGLLGQWARQFGVPVEALKADYFTNGGKKIAELIAERTKPNWQNVNGNLVNTNAPGFKGGIQPGLSVSNNGQATAWQVGPDGQVVVGAPQGALDTYRAYQDINNRSSAAYTPGRPTIAPGGRMVGQSQLSEITGAPPAGAAPAPLIGPGVAVPGMTGRAGPTNAAEQRMAGEVAQVPYNLASEIQATERMLNTPGAITNPQDRANATQYLADLRAKAGAAPATPSAPLIGPGAGRGTQGTAAAVAPPAPAPAAAAVPGGGVEFSPAEKAQQDAERTRQVEQAKVDVQPQAAKDTKFEQAVDAVALIDKTLKHPGLRQATGMQGALDPRNYIAGTNAKDFQVLLDQLKGGVFLTAYNQLKGGGAITEVEGRKAEDAIARMNRAQTTDSFIEALNDYRTILERGIKKAGGSVPAPGSAQSNPTSAGKISSGWTVRIKE